MIPIDCYKGAAGGDHAVFPFDPAQMLTQVRMQLTTGGFLHADTTGIAYRFVAMQSDTSALQDSLVPLEIENLVPLSGVLRNGSVLVCTNTLAQRQPDLVGNFVNRFADRNVSVEIGLNSSDPDAAAANRSAGATQLLMLHNVVLTSGGGRGGYDNVCVCVDGSVVAFNLTTWGAAGFQYYVAPDAGEAIVNADLNICFANSPNHYATAWIARYSAHPSTIQIRGTASLGIPGSETARYQKVTFKARSIRSYAQGGQTYSSDQAPPPAPVSFQVLSAGVIDTVPGGSITPGTPTPGPQSNQQFGQPIYNIVTDDWTRALGEVVVYFFVFPDWQIANTVIRGINANPTGPILM